MKTSIHTKIGAAVLAAALCASPVFGAQNSGRSDSRETASQSSESGAWGTVKSPFVFMGKTGCTILRTPLILGETMVGERKVIGKRGLFMKDEEAMKADERNVRHPLFRD